MKFMNVDAILAAFNSAHVKYLLIGGVNYLLRHEPVLTYDVDLWIEDTSANRRQCEIALASLDAEWGPTEADWRKVADMAPGWLERQMVFCLTSAHGAVDVFRAVTGLSDWDSSYGLTVELRTESGTPYRGICDEDMLRCQLALPEIAQNRNRISQLRNIIRK